MSSTAPSSCERCRQLEDQLLRCEQTAFNQLQTLSDSCLQWRERCEQHQAEQQRLQGSHQALIDRLQEAEATIRRLERQSAWMRQRDQLVMQRLAALLNRLG